MAEVPQSTLRNLFSNRTQQPLFQGPVPQGYDTERYRQTGFTRLGSSGGGGGGNQLSAGNVAKPTVDQSAYNAEREREIADTALRERQAREQAAGIFDPLAESFGNQLSGLSSELDSLRGGVERGFEAGRGLIDSQLQRAFNTLGQQETSTRENTQKSLRSLAEDQRNTTTSLARQLGARGAGDTSAGDYASAAIGRQGLKQRGGALEAQQEAIRGIENQRVEAQRIADQENLRLQQAKEQQLNSLTQDYGRIMRELDTAKATASSDEQRYIADRQNQLRDRLTQQLSNLESEVRNRRAALDDWSQKQQIELQNSLSRIARSGSYSGLGDMLKRIGAYGDLTANLTPQASSQIAGQILPEFSSYITPGAFQVEVEEEDPLDQLLNSKIQGLVGNVGR